MRAISSSSVSLDEVLASLSALRNVTLPKLFQNNVLLTSYMPFQGILLSVRRCTFSRSRIFIYPSFNAQLQLYRCRSVALPLPSGSSTAAVRQRYHRPVVERSPPSERRESLHRETGRPRFQLDNDEVCGTSSTTYAYLHSQRENSVYTEILICVLKRRPNLRAVKAK